jgi:uncharacterized protein (DUF433 family)
MPDIIEKNPRVLGGEPVIKGTRIPIARIVALVVHGYEVKDFKNDYPYLNLSKKDLADIFAYYHHQLER